MKKLITRFNIVGVKHGNADALSRRPLSEDNLIAACYRLDPDWRHRRVTNDENAQPDMFSQNTVPEFNWVDIQKRDSDIRFIYDLILSGASRPDPAELSVKSGDVEM